MAKRPSTGQNLPPPAPRQNRKRKVDNVDIHNSKYFQIGTIVKELRPYFIEVLRTPDFRNCNAAHEIRRKMKLMMDLYKQMTLEIISIGKCKNVSEGQPLSGESKVEQKHMETHQQKKQADHSQIDYVPKTPPEEKNPLLGIDSQMKPKDGQILGTYIVGGSASSWNFIVYPGSKAVYYGVTKESFRAQK